jgi:hypothetical protein
MWISTAKNLAAKLMVLKGGLIKMKKIFRKAMTVLGSAALIGATVGAAAAAAYPAQFTSNTAIVYGANSVDSEAATNIQNILDGQVGGSTGTTLTGGESFSLDKTSTHMNFGDALNKVYSSLDENEMDFLAEGSYDDGDIDADYDQTVTLGSLNMTQFADKDFDDDTPTIGWMFTKDDLILNYTLNFQSSVNATEMAETDMPFLGKEYYVLEADTDTITLLDSANSALVSDGEDLSIGGKTVSIAWIDGSEVKLKINGEVTDKMSAGDSEELEDGSYVVVTEVLSSTRETTVQQAEFSIGSGMITLEDGDEVTIGTSDDDIDGLVAHIDSTGVLIDSVTLSWSASKDTFLAEGKPITMPGFGTIGIGFDGLSTPSDSETIALEAGETLTLNMGNFDLPVVTWNGTAVVQGEEDYPLVIATTTTTYAAAGYANASTPFFESAPIVNTSTLSSGLVLQEDDRFIVTNLDDDLSEIETLYYEVEEITVDDGEYVVTFTDLIGDDDLEFTETSTDDEAYEVTVTIDGFKSTNDTVYVSFDAPGTERYNIAVSETGLIVRLPTLNSTAFGFTEANDDGDLNEGSSFNATVAVDEDEDKVYVTYSGTGNEQEISNDKYVDIIQSKLASIVTTDESGDQYDFSIEYFGEEVTADVSVTAGGVASEGGSESGVMTYKDSESASFADKPIIVVGGSAINSVAAEILGSAYAEQAFTDATGVAAGEFMIGSYLYKGKTALLVAGYNAEDTTKAVTYLNNNMDDIDTTVGNVYIGSTETSAELVVESE